MSSELERLRSEIEQVDQELVRLIARRIDIARSIGEAKKAAGLPTLDPAREAQLLRRIGTLAREAGLEPEELRAVFWQLISMTRRAQTGDL